jgi:serine phosphatase RsbU (regulator of sigma subunit)
MVPAYLRVMTRGREERRFVLERDSTCIGRSADNDLAIPDLSLSREHARVLRRDDLYFILDRGSRNGTFLNDRPVKGELALRDGDVVRLGETTLIFREEGSSGVRFADAATALGQGSVSIPAADIISSTFRGASAQDARLLDVFARASRMLIAKGEAADVYNEVLNAAMDAVHAERGALMLLEGKPPELVSKATVIRQGDPALVVSRTILRVALEEKNSVITTDAQIDPRFGAAQSISIQGIRAAMAAPLWHEERVAGLLYLDRRFSSKQFSESDLSLLTVLANLTAAKLENLRLLEESLAKRKLEEELQLAADIQRNLLPREDPNISGWEFAGMSISSRSVGGDLYDYIPKPSGHIGLVVADVSGKGMSAALLMASLQANLRAFAESTDDLSKMMLAVNRALCSARIRNKFATILYADLDPRSGRAHYVNAGHNPGLVARADGRVDRLSVGGMIAGAFPVVKDYEVGVFDLGPGDVFVAYSDGVTEAEGPGDDQFGDERLALTIAALRREPAAAVRDGILEAVHAFTGGSLPSDDTTLLVARRVG